MKLHVTHFSPFARMARVMLREKGLDRRIEEIMAVTRRPDSPYYKVNPSGRVPFLERDGAPGIEGSQPVCWFLDHLDGAPGFDPPGGETYLDCVRLEERARSFVDGVSVWVRELGRPPEDRSAAVIEHERERMYRLADFWQTEIGHPLMQADLNMPQLTLACGLLLDQFYPGLDWRDGRPALGAWVDQIAARRSFRATEPESQLAP